MVFSTAAVVTIVSVLFASIIPAHIALSKNKSVLNKTLNVLLPMYLVLLYFCTLSTIKIGATTTAQILTNGEWFAKTFSTNLTNIPKTDLLINLAMMFPIGFAVSAKNSNQSPLKTILKGLAIGALLGLSIELLQFALPINRNPSLSDIVLNGVSGAIGGIGCAISNAFINHKEAKALEECQEQQEITYDFEIETENQKQKKKQSAIAKTIHSVSRKTAKAKETEMYR